MTRRPGVPPDFDPYFTPDDLGPKGKGNEKGKTRGVEEIRRDLLPTEATFQVAGTTAMVFGSLIFVTFATSLPAMLMGAGMSGGVFDVEDRSVPRVAAQRAMVLGLAVAAATMGSGLRGRLTWARRALIALGFVPLLAPIVGLWLRARGITPDIREFGEFIISPLAVLILSSAAVAAWWAAFSPRGRAVFATHHQELIARTPQLAPDAKSGLRSGLVLGLASLVLIWNLIFLLSVVVASAGVFGPV